ncbi:MAG TPA: hypothetical protein VHG72_02895 [Polyangia bacterium]|nr:hypothetical protein [Polyangia bacterium]
MNRLRDEVGLDPVSEKGIEILRSVRETTSPAGLKRRVWVSLQSGPAPASVRLRPPVLRAVLIGFGVFAFAATAAATIGGRQIARRLERLFVRPAAVAPLRLDHTRPRVVVAERAVPAAPEVSPALAEAPDVRPAVEERPTVRRRPGPHAAPLSANDLAVSTAETALERSQVLDALVAFRRDHDPARAAALLDHDLEAHRHSALRQEALVLAIEVADARGDRRGGEAFAHTYRREFPSGRFAAFVTRYLEERGTAPRPPATLP